MSHRLGWTGRFPGVNLTAYSLYKNLPWVPVIKAKAAIHTQRITPIPRTFNMPFFRDSKDPVVGAADTASVAPSQAETLVDDADLQHFTATGRPMPPYNPSGWANLSGAFVAQAPQHLPYKYTDDSLIPVPVIMEAPAVQDARYVLLVLGAITHSYCGGKRFSY